MPKSVSGYIVSCAQYNIYVSKMPTMKQLSGIRQSLSTLKTHLV